MAVTVKRIDLWRSEVENRPGTLAQTLEPLAAAGADLKVLMGYRFHGAEKAAIEVYPVAGKKLVAAAGAANLAKSAIPTLLVEGDNKPGLGHAIAKAIADAGINLGFTMALGAGRKFTAVLGFENDDDARRAASLVKKAAVKKAK